MKNSNNEKRTKFKLDLINISKMNGKWILLITVLSFILSMGMSYVSSEILEDANFIIALSVVLVIIIINILFDIVGTAITAVDEMPFHAMASKKTKEAKYAILLIKNAHKVSNFCNDVVGDICGVISGAATTFLVVNLAKNGINLDNTVFGLVLTALVAALTVGGKSLGKAIALENSTYIIHKTASIIRIAFIKKTKKQNRK